jgi:hypothetical protein
MHRFSLSPRIAAGAVGLSALLCAANSAAAAVTAAEVVSYDRGSGMGFTNSSAALGLPVGDTTFNALTPFNPPFSDQHIVIVGGGGHVALRLSSPVTARVAGPEIGVFSNNGIVDVSPNGTGTAGNPAATFSPVGSALVSVSGDGVTFVPLGAGPIAFGNPTNYYTDVRIENYSAPLGSQVADFSSSFTGTLSSFNGLTYEQMVALLDGSAGGTWLDISSTGLSSARFVRFDVPEGSRLVLDAVTAVPEPGAIAFLVLPLLALGARRRSVRR